MDFREYINKEKEKNKPVCFFTINDRVKYDELEKKIKGLAACGYGGIYLHARSGYIGEYLSDEWFALTEKILVFCERYRLEFWIYDEFGWPSGIVGGTILKEEPALKQKRLTKNLTPTVKKGRVVAFYDASDKVVKNAEEARYSIEETAVDGYVDVLDRRVAERFMTYTHEAYQRRFGCRLKGFFTDEPQFGLCLPAWNEEVEREIFAKFGEGTLNKIPALFCGNDKESADFRAFRAFYFELCSSLFLQNYVRPLSLWCEKNGYMLTGHILEEKKLSYQLRSCADVFDVYALMQCPGMDCLGSKTDGALSPKQVSSSFQRYKKSRCVSETGATMGYGTSLEDVLNLFEWEISQGITNICGIIPYSVRGRRKRDYPSGIVSEQPYFEKLVGFNDRISRLCAISALEEVANVLLVQPLRGAREYYAYGQETEKTAYYDKLYEEAVDDLSKKACLYHICSESELESGVVANGGIKIGCYIYDSVVVLDGIGQKIAEQKRLVEYGVRVYESTCDVPSRVRSESEELLITVHRYADYYLLIAKNCNDYAVSGNITLDGKLPSCEFDLDDGSVYDIEEKTIRAKQTAVYVYGTSVVTQKRARTKIKKIGENDFRYDPLQNNTLVLDYADYRLDNGESGTLPVIRLFERLIDIEYCGNLTMTFSFENRGYNGKASLFVEDSQKFEVFLNGEKLSFSDHESEPKFLKNGKNKITLKANCVQDPFTCKIWKGEIGVESDFNMIGDMFELENLLLKGNFGVYFDDVKEDGRVYSCAKPYIAPGATIGNSADLTLNGYPFYVGAFALEKEIELCDGENAIVPIPKNGCVEVNGETLYFGKPIKINDVQGRQKLRLVLYNSLRNCFGPDHNIYGDGMSVGFTTFSSKPGWCDPQGKDMWIDRYMLLPFGVKFKEE